jgi:signal transduction histidine kinase
VNPEIIKNTASNILIVDDLPANLKVLGAILETEGYNVRPVPNGRLALQVADREKPDLILLDVMMPGMDGFEVCRQLKENIKLSDIPVIFISALNETNDVVQALSSGGVDYITKPFQSEEVLARVKTHLNTYRQRKEIEEQARELKKLNSERDKIYSIIAHDLRSPFNSFLGLTQILTDDLLHLQTEDIQDIAANMRTSATNLYRLLENLLDWTRIKQGLIHFNPEVLKLQTVVSSSLVMVKEQSENKNIEVSLIIPPGLQVFTDKNTLQSVIRNLVSNAVKFTPRDGKVIVTAKETGNKMVEISVKDSGIGMSRTLINDLFRTGVSTSRTGTEGEASTGLGLIICKDLLGKQGSELWVESEEGKGSTFYFTLPYEK